MLAWHAQEHVTSCVTACVRMVLTHFGQRWTEAQVRQILGRPRLGITLFATHTQLIQAGATASFHDDWNIYDLRDSLSQGHYPIIGVERQALGHAPASHAIVVVSITSHHVEILDPLDGPQLPKYGMNVLELAWKLSGQEALIIEAPPRESATLPSAP